VQLVTFLNLYLMFHECAIRFDVTGNLENFAEFVRPWLGCRKST